MLDYGNSRMTRSNMIGRDAKRDRQGGEGEEGQM
jgi:hypothetical protein